MSTWIQMATRLFLFIGIIATMTAALIIYLAFAAFLDWWRQPKPSNESPLFHVCLAIAIIIGCFGCVGLLAWTLGKVTGNL